MALLIILLLVFAGVALMVFFGERYSKPLENEQQAKYSKIIMILVFVLLIAGIIKSMM
jgi:predicted permease